MFFFKSEPETLSSKDYYTKLISIKAKFSNNSLVLKRDFSLNEDQILKVFLLLHMVCSQAYVKAFNYNVLNSILYTNTKLHKIGYITDDKCSFCKSEPSTSLDHVSVIFVSVIVAKFEINIFPYILIFLII